MAKYHTCPRCGLESRSVGRSWPDRHPTAATTATLFTLVWMSLMLATYPVAAGVLIAVAAVGGLVYGLSRRQARRDALAARADWERTALQRELAARPCAHGYWYGHCPICSTRAPHGDGVRQTYPISDSSRRSRCSEHREVAGRRAPNPPAWHLLQLVPTEPLPLRRAR